MKRPPAPIAVLVLAVLAGCASGPEGPTRLEVVATDYAAAFDAATDLLRAEGFSPTLQDRRGGLIETEPARAAGLLEPWAVAPPGDEQVLASTLATQRRRARVRFRPAGTVEASGPEAELGGPDLLGLPDPLADLTAHEGPIEVRVQVLVERSDRPGVRVSTWSRRLTTRTTEGVPGRPGETRPALTWRPVARDDRYERWLLGALEARLSGAEG